MVAWANEEGFAQQIQEYPWETWDSGMMEQSRQDFLQDNIAPFLATKTKAELLEGAAKRRIFWPRVYRSLFPENPQLSFRDFWKKVSHRELNDTLIYPGPFVKVEQCPQQIFRPAPLVGEHNQEIYEDTLGMSTEQLILLRAQGVI